MGYGEFLEAMGWQISTSCKYCEVGTMYQVQKDDMDGIYWYYETENFIINIHDFTVKEEIFVESFPDMSPYMSFSSSYLKTASGECFNPYQNLTSNTMYVTNVNNQEFRFLLHANFPYLSVGVNFKEKMIAEYITDNLDLNFESISDLFFETRDLVIKPMEKLANAILNCKMQSPAAEIFLEAKAKEWLSVTISAYLDKQNSPPISKSDEKSIENVAIYINDHYVQDIPQSTLEKIAMMSGTKLKNVFKQRYHMTITEYTQRKRMNQAETLLLTTDMDIKDIAKSVGYISHSRFSSLFKKYKGLYPREIRKFG